MLRIFGTVIIALVVMFANSAAMSAEAAHKSGIELTDLVSLLTTLTGVP